MPIKSTGCGTCRKRKIRCDETRPSCNRCKTHNVPCPGYRLPAKGQVAFQDDTHSTVLKAHKQYKTNAPLEYTRSNSTSSSSSSSSGSSSSDQYALSLVPTKQSESPSSFFNEDDLFLLQGHEVAQFMSPTFPSPHYLPSPAVERALLYSSFVDTYIPKARGLQDSHFSFLQHLITTPGLRSEVAEALDALSMVQVGTTYNDTALVGQAVKAYSKSLGGLMRTLGTGAIGKVNDDYVLATVTLLASCEFYEEIAQGDSGWSKHIQGSQQLLAARGPDSIQSELSLMIYSNMRHGALSHALIARKACFMGTPEWRSVAWRAPYVDAATLLYDSALQVPALLERADNLDSESSTFLSKIDNILGEAKKLCTELRTWYEGYDKSSKFRNSDEDSLYWLTKVANFPTFVSLCSDRSLSEAYMFPSFMVGYLLSVYWNTMHFLLSTVQRLHIRRYEASQNWLPSPKEAVREDELMSHVMNLCRCFPFFCEPMSSSTGKIGLFLPLRTASLYFIEHGHWQMLKWVGNVRDSVFASGLRPPRVGSQTTINAVLGPLR